MAKAKKKTRKRKRRFNCKHCSYGSNSTYEMHQHYLNFPAHASKHSSAHPDPFPSTLKNSKGNSKTRRGVARVPLVDAAERKRARDREYKRTAALRKRQQEGAWNYCPNCAFELTS